MPIKQMQRLVKSKLKRTKAGVTLDPAMVQAALKYIDEYWLTLEKHNTKDHGSLIGLPHPYLVPASGSGDFRFEEQYYWDSYFTALGLQDPKHEKIVVGMLENMLYLLDRFGVIPNASRMYFVGRSQPPLLTSYIFHVYENYKDKDEDWLRKAMQQAKREYETVWMSQSHPHWRNVQNGLSRYYDVNVLHDLAEAESGWDMTTRFKRKCLDYLPVDLNSLLYKYEVDFAYAAAVLGDMDQHDAWVDKAELRKKAMTEVMWSDRRDFFFDYNYVTNDKSPVFSLAAFYTMWAGVATEKQAAKLVQQLKKFEHAGGLTTTVKPVLDRKLFGSVKAQWAYPNGWAPLHYIVIEGLERYGYHKEAEHIARKWIKTNTSWHHKHGVFLEKYNVVSPTKPPVEGVYPSQTGFGWTNGVYNYLVSQYSENK